eukprot:4354102-Prymnesium_polylepis.1
MADDIMADDDILLGDFRFGQALKPQPLRVQQLREDGGGGATSPDDQVVSFVADDAESERG